MKRIWLILPLLLTTLVYSQSKVDINDLVEVDGKIYKPMSDELYSGIVYDLYSGTDKKKLEGFYRDGLKNGKWTWWNVFGGIDSTGSFRKGLFYGQWKYYHSNGQLKAKGNYRNGDGTNRDAYGLTSHGRHGKWTFWYEDGMQASEITYKEGEIVGNWTSWNEQGQKVWEGTQDEYQSKLVEEAAKREAEEKAVAEKKRKAAEAEKARLAAEAAKKVEKARLSEESAQKNFFNDPFFNGFNDKQKQLTEIHYLVDDDSVIISLNQIEYAHKDSFIIKIEAKNADNMHKVGLLPLEKNFTVISGPAQQTNYQFVNGEAISSKSLIWTLVTNKGGTLAIPPLTIEIDGKRIISQPYFINDFIRVDCQAKYDEGQAAYEAGDYEGNIALKRELTGMGCDEELSSKAQYQIGWSYGNKLFDMDKAQAEYQKGADNYSSGLKYVEKCEEKLALYKKDGDAEVAWFAEDFAKAAYLREEIGMSKAADKALRAKNLYHAGYIYHKKVGDNDKARVLYETVITNFFGSPYVESAKQKLKSL